MTTFDSAIPRDLEDLIDAVAAEMTQAVPSPDFAARVMASIDRRPGIKWSRVASGIAAVAAAALFAFWLPRAGNPPHATVPAANAGATELTSGQASGHTVIREAVPESRPRRVSHVPEISADEAAWLSRSLPPLAVAPVIGIEAIQPERATIAPITVPPLVAEPIDLTPLVMTSSSNGGR